MVRRLLFRNFRTVYRLDRWMKRRLTPAGMLAAAGLFTGALFGIDTRQSLAFELFALAGALFVVAVACTAAFRCRLAVVRHLPRYATVDEPLAYTMSIRNRGAKVQSGLRLTEELEVRMPSFDEFLRGREPGAETRNRFDRYVGYPRWLWLLRRGIGAETAEIRLPDLPAEGELEVEVRITPRRRGYIRFRGITVARPDPLGLVRALGFLPGPGSLLALPKCYPMEAVVLPGASRERRGRVAAIETAGGVDEFVALREYRPGDPLRHIHWKSLARLGVPVVKEFQDESQARVAVVLDTFVERGESDRFETAVSVAASLVTFGVPSNGTVDLMFFNRGARAVRAGVGGAETEHLLILLACVQESTSDPFERLREMILPRAGEMSACICVLLEWDDARRALVEELGRSGVDVRPLVVGAPGEVSGAGPGSARVPGADVVSIGVDTVAADLARLPPPLPGAVRGSP